MYYPQFENIELDIIATIWSRPEFISEISAIDPKLFVDHKEFFEKSIDFNRGERRKFTIREQEMTSKFVDNFIVFPVVANMVEELRKHYINHNIKTAPLKTEKDLEALISKITTIKDYQSKTTDDFLEEIIFERAEGISRGINTGIAEIDKITVGLKGGHFWIIGGYTNVGKTQFSLEIIKNITKENLCFFYSLEMTTKDILERMLYMFEGEIGSSGVDELRKLKLKIIEGRDSLVQIETHLMAQKEKPKVIVIDFLQNIETNDKTEYERLSRVARQIQKLALREKICIIGLSQLSNDAVNSQNKKTMGFKGSGALAAACDVGIELVRMDVDDKVVQVPMSCRVRKNKHGKTKDIDVGFDKSRNRIIF